MAQKKHSPILNSRAVKSVSQTGYDLKRVFEDDIGEFWQAQHSQIYPELKRLEQADRITHVELIAGTKLKKRSSIQSLQMGLPFF